MGPPVRYIPKTHEYYRRLGYPIPYKYARFDTTPFARLGEPLERCQVGLVATAGVTLVDDDGRPAPMKPDLPGRGADQTGLEDHKPGMLTRPWKRRSARQNV
jgi:hypothetical protein